MVNLGMVEQNRFVYPVKVAGLTGVVAVAAGAEHSVALKGGWHGMGMGPQFDRAAWKRGNNGCEYYSETSFWSNEYYGNCRR